MDRISSHNVPKSGIRFEFYAPMEESVPIPVRKCGELTLTLGEAFFTEGQSQKTFLESFYEHVSGAAKESIHGICLVRMDSDPPGAFRPILETAGSIMARLIGAVSAAQKTPRNLRLLAQTSAIVLDGKGLKSEAAKDSVVWQEGVRVMLDKTLYMRIVVMEENS